MSLAQWHNRERYAQFFEYTNTYVMSNSPLHVQHKPRKRGVSWVERLMAIIIRRRIEQGRYIDKRRKR